MKRVTKYSLIVVALFLVQIFAKPLGEIQNNVGLFYYKGTLFSQNFERAVYWYKKAASREFAVAQYNLGMCYLMGEGITQDFKEAVKWFKKAADQENAIAQFDLGTCYLSGQGVTQDFEEGVKWFKKSADHGYKYAQDVLSMLSQNGLIDVPNVQKDDIKKRQTN